MLGRLKAMNNERGWIVFFGPDGRELLRISKKGLAPDEIGCTIDLLAYERGLSVCEISFAEVSK